MIVQEEETPQPEDTEGISPKTFHIGYIGQVRK